MSATDAENAEQPWFVQRGGVHFSCQSGCTRCCGGAPGDVFVSEDEIARIAAFMNIPVKEFHDSFVRHYASGKLSIKERRNGDCVLLERHGCGVYDVRPEQCRQYPFWPELMASEEAWIKESLRCPGLNEGEWHPAITIVEMLKKQQQS